MTNQLNLRQSLNPAFLKIKPHRNDIEEFKSHAIKLLDIKENEGEEFHKTLLSDFLKDTYYRDKHYINIKGRNDLVIHNGKDAHSSVGVIIEVKSPTNKAEMLSCADLNKKAMQELVLYYLRERITHNNLELKHLVVSNINEWFIFDARLFESYFAENKELVKLFTEFENGTLAGNKTYSFYKDIAAAEIEKVKSKIKYTYFSIRNYKNALQSNDKESDEKLIPLFKFLSPEHLLKLPFSNDGNSLNKEFYNELLHIIGLTENKVAGKKLIQRKEKPERNSGSLLEQSINEISSLGKINRLDNPSQFGTTLDEQLFSIGLELSITWINRLLFLRLLEAQLIVWHQGDKNYIFLNNQKIKSFVDLNSLFFQVLARKQEDRSDTLKKLFSTVPYLKSSLFELTELEDHTITIRNLNNTNKLPVFATTVLKDAQGKKRTGELDTLKYLFEFLQAYDFASEGTDVIQENNKTLISASVLGLIFEKINGYKDGSFFTPSFITMYMCRETLRYAVVNKFNERKGWQCQSINELYDKIENTQEANEIINSLKICDPAVGSGHFLVSALNEIIAIKSELQILQYRKGNRLKNYHIEIVNDELIITDEEGDVFFYKPKSPQSQRLQEALFHEKQTIIENCLFGIDINPNSVKICRLRLWIELLKNAYYINDDRNPRQLETLPNIDINIQCGNSLISRFALDVDLKTALLKSKINISDFKAAFHRYQNAKTKDEKQVMESFIADIKSDFRTEIYNVDPKVKRIKNLIAEQYILTNQISLIEDSTEEKDVKEKKIEQSEIEIAKLNNELDDIKNNKIYDNAFEWRFEFPEVLNDDGDFVGFDVTIGNPPYIFARNSLEKGITAQDKSYFYAHFELASYQVNLYPLFIEKGYHLIKKTGILSYITPNNWLTINTNKNLRKFTLQQSDIKIVNFYAKVFDNASVDSCIIHFSKSSENKEVELFEYTDSVRLINSSTADYFLSKKNYIINIESFKNNQALSLIDKIELSSIELSQFADIKVGLKSYQIGKGTPLQTKEIKDSRIYHAREKLDNTYIKYFDGKDICRYFIGWSGEFLKYGSHLAEPRNNFMLFSTKRILVRQIPSKPPYCIHACLIKETALNDLNSMNIINFKETPELILAVLNSRLISYWFIHKFGKMQRGIFPQFKVNELASFPMPKTFEPHRENLIKFVNKILAAKKRKPDADTSALEKQIDALVYELYGLTADEIKIIENK